MSVEQYLERLREDSIYIKLESDKKFGGAIDIDSLVKVLKSINQSYKNFLEIELYKSEDVRTSTPTGKKEFKNFISDSELLIVDLDFSSFGAAITPNIATANQYSNIKNSLNLKKQSFDTYKNDVLNFNYNDTKFIDRIAKKYSPEERNLIYKPIIDNIISAPKFKVYYGKDKSKLKKAPGVLKESVVHKLITSLPSNVTTDIVKKQDEEMYVMYVTTDSENDLFGKKPKYSKLLATSKLEKPVYPYQINEIRVEKSTYVFKSKLSADVSLEDDIFTIAYPDLNIEVWGDNREESEEAFNFALQSIIKNIYLEKDKNLTDRAMNLKNYLNSIIKSIIN